MLMKPMEKYVIFPIALFSTATVIFLSYEASRRDFSQLDSVLLQLFSLFIGVTASFYFGRQSAKSAAKEIIKPHARSAFRRLLSLYKSLSRLAAVIEVSRRNKGISSEGISVLDRLQATVIEQIATADDALEDWRDIVPEDVEELQRRVRIAGQMEDKS